MLRLMNSTGRLVVDRLLCSTAAMTLCSRVSNSSARHLRFEFLGQGARKIKKINEIFLRYSQKVNKEKKKKEKEKIE